MENIDLSALSTLKLPKVGQLGYVVNCINKSLPYYASIYNLGIWFTPIYASKEFLIGSDKINLEMNLTFAYSGNIQIELIETRGSEDNLYNRHLKNNGEGFHHLGFYVNDLDKKVRQINKLGIEVLMKGKLELAGGGLARFAYLDTIKLCGTILELTEVRLYGLSVPQTPFMMNIAALTGDVKKQKFN